MTPPHPTPVSTRRVAVVLGSLVALTIIASSAVAVALPVLAEDLDLGLAGTAWVLAAFILALSVSTPLFGRLTDVAGLRRPLRVGAAMFAAGSLIAAASTSFPLILTGRFLQGAGAGAVPVLSQAIIFARFPGPGRARAISSLTAVILITSASGPLIGGALTELISWRAVLGLPAIAAVLAEAAVRMAPRVPASGDRVDVAGAALVGVAATSFAVLLQAPALPRGIVAVITALVAVTLGLVIRHVRNQPAGFLPRIVVTSAPLMASAGAMFTIMAGYVAGLFAVPRILALNQGWAPLQIGLAMLPAAILGAAVSPIAGRLVARMPRRAIVGMAGLSSAAGLGLAGGGAGNPVMLVIGFALIAASFGAGQVSLVDGIPTYVPEEVRGIALGVFNLLFFSGGAAGASAISGLAAVVGLPAALAALAALPLIGTGTAVVLLGRHRAG